MPQIGDIWTENQLTYGEVRGTVSETRMWREGRVKAAGTSAPLMPPHSPLTTQREKNYSTARKPHQGAKSPELCEGEKVSVDII